MINNLKDNIMDLGSVLKTVRKNNGFTQIDFCKQSGISQTYLSQIETNKRNPTLKVLKKIAETTKTPLPLLFWFSLSEKDISKDKLAIFKQMKPIIDGLTKAFFE